MNMAQIPENVRQILVQLVPAAIIHDITCFVFYDNHPLDLKQIDITVCTKTGEVREYFQRDLLSSVQLDNVERPTEIKILRNNECELFYLISAVNRLIILTRKKTLQVHHEVNNLDKYDITDLSCSGKASLKVIRKDDAVPLTFDDNFESFLRPDISQTFTELNEDDALPILTHLKRKLTEARYSVKCNERSHNELLHLRQLAAYSMYKSIHPNIDDSVIKGGSKEMSRAVKVISETPWVKVCNKKLVIVLTVCNQNEHSLNDVHILLHGTTRPSLTYITKLFEKSNTPPFWKEARALEPNKETAVVTVLELEEIKHNVSSKIEFNGVIFYEANGKEYLLPVENVNISILDTMGQEFDVMTCEEIDEHTLLAILATSEKTDLILRHTNSDVDNVALGTHIFCKYMDMEQVLNTQIVVHRKSPYHLLNGVMIKGHNDNESANDFWRISVYSRTPSQVLALVHCIHDAVPMILVVTTPDYTITPKHKLPTSKYASEEAGRTLPSHNFLGYASSILDRSYMILEYLNSSMIKMYESKNPVVQGKVGAEIDLFAGGAGTFAEFREKMMQRACEGVKSLFDTTGDVDAMVID